MSGASLRCCGLLRPGVWELPSSFIFTFISSMDFPPMPMFSSGSSLMVTVENYSGGLFPTFSTYKRAYHFFFSICSGRKLVNLNAKLVIIFGIQDVIGKIFINFVL